MRVIFVNRFYWPETPATGQLLTDLAEALAARGHEVIVITSAATKSVPRIERHRSVMIRRVAATRWARRGVAAKAIDFATFYLNALGEVLRCARRGTIVVSMTDPPLLGVGVAIVARMRGARLVHWVQDIYPEVALALTGQPALRLFRPIRDAAWRDADACVTVGEDMAAVIHGSGVPRSRAAVIANWAPRGVALAPRTAASPIRAAWGGERKFVVLYSGNLGRVHDLEPLLALAAALRDTPAIAIVFVGEGAQRDRLQREAQRLQLSNTTFHPAQPRDQLPALLTAADLHVVTLLPGCEDFVFPSKLYGAAAAGRPVLFIGPRDAEPARQVRNHGLGFAASRDEIEAMACFVRELSENANRWNEHARAAERFAAHTDAATACARWIRLLEDVHACGAPSRDLIVDAAR